MYNGQFLASNPPSFQSCSLNYNFKFLDDYNEAQKLTDQFSNTTITEHECDNDDDEIECNDELESNEYVFKQVILLA